MYKLDSIDTDIFTKVMNLLSKKGDSQTNSCPVTILLFLTGSRTTHTSRETERVEFVSYKDGIYKTRTTRGILREGVLTVQRERGN